MLSDDELVLIIPSKEMKEEILQYKEEHFKFRDMQVHGSGGLAYYDNFDAWLEHIDSIRQIKADGDIQTSTFFSKRLSDGKLIGCIKFHHSLNDELKNGGHIAYGIRPSERRKGYATEMLRQLLGVARESGLDELHLSVERDNEPSVKTIKRNGGIYERSFEFENELADIYRIAL